MKALSVFGAAIAVLAGAGLAQAAPAHKSYGFVVSAADGTEIPGAWTAITRTDSGYTFQLHTSGLPAGHAVTDWQVVFNNAAACAVPFECSEADSENPATASSVFYGTGRVIGPDGTGNYGGHVAIGRTDRQGNLPQEQQLLFGPGLTNPRGAEIIQVMHDHGPAIPGLLDEEIHSFGIGCSNLPPFTGSYECVDLQFGITP